MCMGGFARVIGWTESPCDKTRILLKRGQTLLREESPVRTEAGVNRIAYVRDNRQPVSVVRVFGILDGEEMFELVPLDLETVVTV